MLSTLDPLVENISSLKFFFYPQTSHLKEVIYRIKLGKCENRRLSWVMITVSSITKIAGRYAMIHTAIFIFL